MLRKIITLFLIATISFSLFYIPSTAFDIDQSSASVEAYYLCDIKNNVVMAQNNCDALISPSSTVKIMTACIVLESGIDTEAIVEITDKILQNVSGRNMELKAGNRLTVDDLLYAMLCGGFNDATIALVYAVSPTIYEFVGLMNEKATELGMLSTHYANPTGMEATAAKTTVNDLAILAKYMSGNAKFVEICSAKYYQISDGAVCKYKTIYNRSSLLSNYKGLANFNTGSSDLGDCAIIFYKTESSTLISIVMNALPINDTDTTNYAEAFSKELISHASNNYSSRLVKDKKTPITSLPVKYSISKSNIDLFLSEDVTLFLSNEIDPQADLIYQVEIYGNELKAPIKSGDVVGMLTVSHNGILLHSTPIIAVDDVDRNNFLFAMDVMKDFITGKCFIIILIAFALCSLYIVSNKKRNRKMKRRRRKR